MDVHGKLHPMIAVFAQVVMAFGIDLKKSNLIFRLITNTSIFITNHVVYFTIAKEKMHSFKDCSLT